MSWQTLAEFGITSEHLKVMGYAFGCHLVVVIVLWAIGRRHKNDSILDVYWGFSFVVAAWFAYVMGDGDSDRARLVLLLVTIWGSRLGYHLFSRWARIHGLGGDLRYQDIKDNMLGPKGYDLKVLFAVYIPMWLSYLIPQLNIMLLIMAPEQSSLNSLDYVFGSLMVLAIIYEMTADLQLDAFKANPANEGKVLKSGLWAWSRHPNYFANFCCYWCLFIISLNVQGLWWTIISPLFMSYLLIGFTGKKWLDEHMRKRRPDYAAYIENTSGFIPMPPRKKT
jgi:steroid 5-alpha reductase family enzyme